MIQDFGPMILPAPIADWERAQIRIKRDLQAKRRQGPWWTGTKEDWKRISSEGSKDSIPDPFEAGARSYAVRKGGKRSFQLANLKELKMVRYPFSISLLNHFVQGQLNA